MGAEHVLAIDLGTGGPKAALVSVDGAITAHAFCATPIEVLAGGGAEQDPDDWWRAVTTAVTELTSARHVPARDIIAVSVTSQWSGTVAVDAEGRHLHPTIIWMDSRGAPEVEELVGGPVRVEGYDPRKLAYWVSRTGAIPSHSGKDPIAHILWLRSHRPDVFAATATFLEPCDYLNARISGRVVASHDSITAHWLTDNRDPHRIDYDDRLLGWCGLGRDQLPDLVPSASVIGRVLPAVADAWGLTADTRVVTATGDVHSAVVGSGALADHQGHLSLGTSSWLSCHVPAKRTDLRRNQAAIPSAIPGRYFLANEHEVAAGALVWLADTAGLVADLDEANALAEAAATGSGGVIFTPWLNGERTPVDDHTIRGGWTGVGLGTGRGALVRSVFEGVALNDRWLLDGVEAFTRRRMDDLAIIGGGARSDLWCQIHADALDRPIRRVADPQHANARGAAMLAWLALGRRTVDEMAATVPTETTFRPDPVGVAVLAELYGEFKNLYKAHRPIHRRLARLR